ncbi:sulfotransferase domain-containing protein [Thalassospira xiamenensis]|uniref:Sulfotransferase domain-containing protein n=1 Tax=Thalassospira xiamenensis TaxID=220697 RepID=A0ABR5Y4F5_9PROT|nr:sulfotransferase domain-containing protein [Thalassospira xiamenensis]KZD05706.1 hypothetical protein AUP40_11910 [Thalassospira xiamenensis]KZD09610.1 hypothetical protein AUP45_13050 [Thalassospira xiamenensis]MCD1595229.1 sulfotransferase domain-containing protein [Thalassospira xiamenensis]
MAVFQRLLTNMALLSKKNNQDEVMEQSEMVEVGDAVPAILFNTMPKSGSVFILRSIENGLRIPYVNVSDGYFPDDLLQRTRFQEFALGNCITQSHVPAHPINIGMLNHYIDRMVLHVRDPRQALLSWTHHVRRFQNDRGALSVFVPSIPDEYFSWSLHEQIEWQIENYCPGLVNWVEGWIDHIKKEDQSFKIMITHYEDFLEDQEKFFKEFFKFYDVEWEKFIFTEVEKSADTNFRSGTLDEWRSVFAESQNEKMLSMMSNEVKAFCRVEC